MAQPDLEQMDIPALRTLIADAQRTLDRKLKKAEADFIKRVKAEARDLGIDLAEAIAAEPSGGEKAESGEGKRPRAPAKPKYANPDDPQQTWTGRGRAPAWAAPYKEQGKLDDILIRE